VFNVGDSRVYVLDDAGLVQLSADDNEPRRPGQHRSSVVTQTLGGHVDAAPIEPHISTRPFAEAARYLIRSDGLTDAVNDTAITAILRSHDGGAAAFELWKATIAAGAPDNMTVALVEIATHPETGYAHPLQAVPVVACFRAVLGLVWLESVSTPSVTALVLSMRDAAAVQDGVHREDHDYDQRAGHYQQHKGNGPSGDRQQQAADDREDQDRVVMFHDGPLLRRNGDALTVRERGWLG
jgi:hypothetical protein